MAVAAAAAAMRDKAERFTGPDGAIDTCGTGGDHSNSFNISTTATFAIAASGVRIAKHGNRAASSRCGSADLLEGLGIQVELTPEQVAESVERVGVGFMYAPAFHPAMRYVGPTRREIGIRTVFNVLGPLTNPAGARHQLIGVGHPEIAGKLAEADFKRLEQTMQIYVEPPRDLEEERRQRHAELDFHSILVDHCDNPVLAFMCRFLQSLLRDLTVCKRIYDEPNPDLRESGLSYQVRLLRALRREDAAAAREIMFEHMCVAQRYMEEREAVLQSKFLQVPD